MKINFRLLAAALLFASGLRAQPTPVPQKLADRLDFVLDSMQKKLGHLGLGAALQRADGSLWAGGTGISSVDPLVKVAPTDAFLIGSVTKTVTSACVLQLVDEGVLSLDDSLHKWLDTFPFIDPNIKIRHLLRHQSGLFDVLAYPGQQDSLLLDPSKAWTAEELVKKFMLAPTGTPGGTWNYCNTNYFLLGMIIEKATGKPFYEAYKERFWGPLGLETFHIPAFESNSVPIAHVWFDITGDGAADDAFDFYNSWTSLNSTAGAAGGFYATPADEARWIRAHMRGDLVSPALMDEAKKTITAPGQPITYGLGLMKKTFLGQTGYGHGGDLAYASSAWHFPMKDVGIAVSTNDGKKNSWTLIPVVTALLKACTDFEMTLDSPEATASEPAVGVFPNPFSGEIRVKTRLAAGDLRLRLADATGREVRSISLPGPAAGGFFEMKGLDDLPPGLYALTISTEGSAPWTVKILK